MIDDADDGQITRVTLAAGGLARGRDERLDVEARVGRLRAEIDYWRIRSEELRRFPNTAGAGLLFGLAVGNLYKLLVFAGAVSFPVMSVTLVCGIVWKKANVTGAWASILTGAVSWVVLVFVVMPHVDGEIWDAIYIASVPAFLCSLLAMVTVSLGTQRSCPPCPIRDVDGNDISGTPLFSWGRRRAADR